MIPENPRGGRIVAVTDSTRTHRFSQSLTLQFTMSGRMTETTQDETTATRSTRAGRALDAPRRRLFVMRSGARLFAVYADEVEATGENLTPTPLPFAPAPVRGLVSQRGRILTLIDPLSLLPPSTPPAAPAAAGAQAAASPAPPPAAPAVVVALKGDEQLALSVESIEREIELYDTEAETEAADAPGNSLLRRSIPYHAHAVALLDPARLFDAAMQGVERRRQRT
ncbi:MAG TPA: chemotaxis protein CheW [Pyrinomonadaceae bacterium]|nr:chemotaxis protein CheW [Pyrinomonadaceae bacterium]